MLYKVVCRTTCPSPLHDELVLVVRAVSKMEAVYQARIHWKHEYPGCDADHMWEVIHVEVVTTDVSGDSHEGM